MMVVEECVARRGELDGNASRGLELGKVGMRVALCVRRRFPQGLLGMAG